MTDPNAPSTEQASRLQDVSTVQLRLSSFWPENLKVSFHHPEAQFTLYRTGSQTARYYHVVSVLSPDVASEIYDVLYSPSDTTPYQHLKTEVLQRLMQSERARLQELLAEGDLGDRRPFQLLCLMRQLLC